MSQRFRLWLIAGGPWVDALGYGSALVVALALQSWPGFQYAEWKLYDQSLKLLRSFAPQPVLNDVVIVAADEASFTAFDEPFALWHGRIGALIDAMVVAQPAVLVLDMVLPSKSFDSVVPGIDHRLLEPLLRARGKLKLVVAQTVDDDLRPRAIFAPYVSLIGAPNVASAVLCLDEDSVVRRVLPGPCDDTSASAGTEPQGLAQRAAVLLDAPPRGRGLIDYRRGDPFTTVSMAQVLRWHADGDVDALRRSFAGKPVMVGVVLPLEDRLRAPVPLLAAEPGNTRLPGVLLHAQVLRSILNHGYLRAAPPALVWALTALACLCWFGHGFRKDLTYWTLFAMLPALGLYALWLGSLMAPAALLVSAKLAYVSRQSLEWMRLTHQRKRLAQAFAGHINPQLLRQVLASDADQAAGPMSPHVQPATVLWLQIPTVQTQAGDPQADSALRELSVLFDVVQQAVQDAGGMVDRFQGTGVAAYFGAPLPLRNHARAALEAALEILRPRAHHDAAAAGSPLAELLPRLRVGIATGPVLTGQAPMRHARPFVMAGPAAQMAVDLAALASQAPGSGQVLVSDATALAVGHTRLRALGPAYPAVHVLDLR